MRRLSGSDGRRRRSVEWEMPSGVLSNGMARASASCVLCGSSTSILRVGALEGCQTSGEVGPNERGVVIRAREGPMSIAGPCGRVQGHERNQPSLTRLGHPWAERRQGPSRTGRRWSREAKPAATVHGSYSEDQHNSARGHATGEDPGRRPLRRSADRIQTSRRQPTTAFSPDRKSVV